ncbi:hypothetical protein NUU61_003305 [Penicillium alfredii]|uniref:Uncharacterized protein n=1 Tax=Penicillium alfredii TaxID=1506179 RepID=A0A9W9KHU7_9EURO|nr:uncharacterized protein NUU61_003305 [Penicillium alfredii]KAJ5105958.1 hypothetical protein NUU61_003305 [Penicillium alfredii]
MTSKAASLDRARRRAYHDGIASVDGCAIAIGSFFATDHFVVDDPPVVAADYPSVGVGVRIAVAAVAAGAPPTATETTKIDAGPPTELGREILTKTKALALPPSRLFGVKGARRPMALLTDHSCISYHRGGEENEGHVELHD